MKSLLRIVTDVYMVLLFVLLFFLAVPAQAQNFEGKYGAFGMAYDPGSTPNLKGWAALAIPISERALSYSDVDFAPVTKGANYEFAGVKLQATFRTGFAYRMYEITKGCNLYALGDAGIAASSENVVGSFAGGGFVDIAIGKGWGALVILQAEKNAVIGMTFTPRVGFRKKL